MNETNSKKKLIIFLILIIVFLLGSVGYLIYDNYIKIEEPKEMEEISSGEKNYYSASYLLEKNYIKEAMVATSEKMDCSNYDGFLDYREQYLYKTNDNKYAIQICEESEEGVYTPSLKVLEMPSANIVKAYYNFVCGQMCTKEVIFMDDQNNIYYSSLFMGIEDTEDNYNNYKNYKIENVKSVYISTYDKPWAYYDGDFRSAVILEMTDGTLKTLKGNNENIDLVNLSESRPYFDYVCALNDPICNETMIYLTFDNKLVSNYNLNDIIKNEKGEEIIAKDAFTTVDLKYEGQRGNITYDNIDDLDYVIYVLDQNNNLYKAELNKDKIDKRENIVMSLYKKNVNEITYIEDADDYYINVSIKYNDGKEEVIKDVNASTMFERNNN